MPRYIITYDLSKPRQNYAGLYSRIMSYGTWAKITESSYAIVTRHTAVEVRDHLSPALDDDDTLLVGPLGRSAWTGLREEVSNWLKNSLS